MELLFKKYFWTVNLVFLFLVAFLVARTANLFIESAITPLPTGSQPTRGLAQTKPVEPPARLGIDTFAKSLGLEVPAEPNEPEIKEPGQEFNANAEPVKTSLRVKLLGTLVAASDEWSIATVQDLGNQRSSTVMVGDKVQGAEVLDIERQRVIINNNGRKEFIDAQGGTGEVAAYAPPTVQPTPGPAVASSGGNFGQGIRALDENTYEVPKAEIDRTLGNLNDVAMQARIVPAFKDGVSQGFKLFSIRPDSIYSKIGVVNGDVIKRINGFDLNSPEKALEVYSKLKEANRVDIEIERNGQTVKKTYNIR